MITHFVMLITGFSPTDDQRLALALAPPIGWWHRLGGGWLVADPDGQTTVDGLRGIVQGINPFAECVVLQVSPGTWNARLRGGRSELEWMDKVWKPGP